ncbi:MAG: glycosyltransferase [Bacteroidaceae bacterium]|nr:glycosyltransferase [Bacteroidaceae bacterium]
MKEDKLHLAGMSADTKIKELVKKLSESETHNIEQKYKKNCNGLLYLYIGRISIEKGADKLINAWKKHILNFPSDCLIMAGDGELLNEFKNKNIKNLQLLGRVDYDSIYKLYAIADVFIIATLQDNWSLVVPEAMSCGIPVATSIYNGCHTDLVIEAKTGFTFDPLKQEEIVETLAKFHKCNIEAMGEAAIKIEEEFSIEKSAQRIYCCTQQL